jgi:hypothetical protein
VTDDEARVRDELLAREALHEITAVRDVGVLTGREQADDGVVTLTFEATMPGYPGWHWTVSLAEVDGLEPTVLEVELLPGDGALLAPEWVPWSVRLEEYRAAQAAAGEPDETAAGDEHDAVDESDEDAGDEDEDDDDDDEDDDDLGDDPDDGIDFESHEAEALGLPPVDVDEQHEPDPEADEHRP